MKNKYYILQFNLRDIISDFSYPPLPCKPLARTCAKEIYINWNKPIVPKQLIPKHVILNYHKLLQPSKSTFLRFALMLHLYLLFDLPRGHLPKNILTAFYFIFHRSYMFGSYFTVLKSQDDL
jgi:hypothetical protein